MKLPDGPYNPKSTEAEILDFWLSNKFYKPEYNPVEDKVQSTEEMKNDPREAWALICPPPNAYARPHIGNISGYAYQDAMARYARMHGKKVLVLPGKDHAGLEGEGVFVREVLEKQKRNKFDMKREDFYKEMMEYFMKNIDIARNDEKAIGLSADFDRDTFTLDPDIVEIVLDTFVEMYKDNRIYKGVRIVNWDPKARSVIADNQCLREEREGSLYYIKYPIVKQKAWKLSFYKSNILERIKSGAKTVETRALNPEEPERYFGDIKAGDLIISVDKSENQTPSVYNKVKGITTYKDLDEVFSKINQENVFGKKYESVEELTQAYEGLSTGYAEKINRNGLVAIELEELGEDDYLTVATTRPETLLGDTAVAMNPEDPRYKTLIEYKTIIPLVDREVPIISSYKVEKGFGTGFLKVTPAHAQDDYQIMNEWNREQENRRKALGTSNGTNSLKLTANSSIGYINVIGKDLRLCGPIPKKYFGMKYKEALPIILEDLKANNLFEKEEKIKQNILISERTKSIVEPLISSQWYLKYDGLKEAAIKMVANDEVKIHPENMVQKFNYWMENLRDWAISRSLWWGYRLPVWYAGEVTEEIDENGKVQELISLSKSGEGRGEVERMPLEYDNPEHIRIQKYSPDREKLVLIPGKHAYASRNIYEKFLDEYAASELTVNNINGPTYQDYETAFQAININEDSVIVAHSLGASAILDYLYKNDIKVKALILLAPTTRKSKNYSRNRENGFWEYEEDYKTKKLADELTIIYSNDENSPEEGFTELGDLIGATLIKEENKKHYAGPDYNNDSEQLVELLESKNLKLKTENWRQDNDVLDTWFSSGQWVYATLTKYNLMNTFFPTDVLVSAHDILENWDSRMMMFTYFKHKNIPFKDLFLTGLVLGKDGQKMSKSRGNIIDMDKVRADYGTDAVRMAYFYQNSAGSSYSITDDKLKNFKQFCNKLWNASKFVLTNLESQSSNFKAQNQQLTANSLQLESNKKILKHITEVKEKITKNIDTFEFGYATDTLYQEFWHTYCDLQIEESKKYLYSQKDKDGNIIAEPKEDEKVETTTVLVYALKEYLKMLHPFIPFITERIWREVPKTEGDHKTLMYTRW